MSKSNTAKKISSAPVPKIHPEMVAEVRKRPKKKKALPVRADSVIDQVKVAFSVSAIGLIVGILLRARACP